MCTLDLATLKNMQNAHSELQKRPKLERTRQKAFAAVLSDEKFGFEMENFRLFFFLFFFKLEFILFYLFFANGFCRFCRIFQAQTKIFFLSKIKNIFLQLE